MENQNVRAHHKVHNGECNSLHDRVRYHSSSSRCIPNLSQMDVAYNEAASKQILVKASTHRTSFALSFFYPSLFSTS